jgi:hypothetical protein
MFEGSEVHSEQVNFFKTSTVDVFGLEYKKKLKILIFDHGVISKNDPKSDPIGEMVENPNVVFLLR